MTKKMTLPFYRLEPDGSESCFLVGIDVSLTLAQSRRLIASIRGLFKYLPTHRVTNIPELDGAVIVGPRLAIETPFSSMAVEITHAVGFPEVGRIEHFRRYAVPSGRDPTEFLKTRRDMVTEEIYEELPCSFQVDVAVPPVRVIPLFEEGRAALDHFNTAENLGFNEAKLQRIERIFVRMGRNPTDVALYQLSQMWSNHCWHDLFFLTHFVIDGERRPYTLIELLREPLKALRGTDADNIMIAGSDNASAVEGSTVPVLVAAYPGEPGPYKWVRVTLHALFSAETHNYPDHVAPYPGSATEIGGEIRDQLGAGSVSDILYALQGRILGSIRFPSGYRIPGEFIRGRRYDYPTDKATPVEVAAKSLQGWHDYADAFGKPCTAGFWFTGAIWRPRRNKRGKIIMERVESLKPVGFGFGGGAIQHQHLRKGKPRKGMLVVQIGGPAYPIGFCGGSGSSSTSGSNTATFDENAVQRGDPEMERRFYQVLLACMARGRKNPIVAIHDQGAGGVANILSELIGRAGGRIYLGQVNRGDPTMSDAKVWVCEYQERQGILIWKRDLKWLRYVCRRENCPIEVLGEIAGDGRLQVFSEASKAEVKAKHAKPIVDFVMAELLAKIDSPDIHDTTPEDIRIPLEIPDDLTFERAAFQTFRRSEVGSKEFVTRGVDGSIGGLVVQNQYCGPFATPVADCSLVAFSSASKSGQAATLGVAPYLTALDPQAGARMSIGEMYTNLMGMGIDNIKKIKCLCNWMWPATLKPPDGEIARLDAAVRAVRDTLIKLWSAIIGGKDSSSMATWVKKLLVKSIETVVFSTAVTVEDISVYVTPEIKYPGRSMLVRIDIANGERRLGGSSFGQTLGQLGADCPNLDRPDLLLKTFAAAQDLLFSKLITAGHDISSGGLAATVAEMCFATGCGVKLATNTPHSAFNEWLAEELGFVVEVSDENLDKVREVLDDYGVPYQVLGRTTTEQTISLNHNGEEILNATTAEARRKWERTGYEFRKIRVNPAEAGKEWRNTATREQPLYRLTFIPTRPRSILRNPDKPKLAVIREQGTNGHVEMMAAWRYVGFDPWEVHLNDFLLGRLDNLEMFRGVIFPGGFTFRDVLGAAVGWALKIKMNPKLKAIFEQFFARDDTFSFGVCNGAQLGLRCGWAPFPQLPEDQQPKFTQIKLGSFNHQWVRVLVEPSTSILFRGMEGSVLGTYVANGEGFFDCTAYPEVLEQANEKRLIPVVYVDAHGRRTRALPYSPSGHYVAGVCDEPGRNTYVMPHMFDRGYLKRLWAWMPPEWRETLPESPWIQIGLNGLDWCRANK